jgi:hypothetical protein
MPGDLESADAQNEEDPESERTNHDEGAVGTQNEEDNDQELANGV